MSADPYWARQSEEWEKAKKWTRYEGGMLTYVSWPVPVLEGKRRVVISPFGLGYRWFVSDSSQLTLDGPVANFGAGFAFSFGAALTRAERVALAGTLP